MQTGARIRLDGGQYRLDAPLAASSYGVVWRATRLADGLAVALKLVNDVQMGRAHPALRARWIDSAAKEIAFLGSLAPWDERHIVRLLDSGEHAGLPAMTLELLGPDLGRHVGALRDAGRRVDLSQALAWLGQINQALAKVHGYGWHYLDLKPANLLLHPRDGGVRLADFGTSRLEGQAPTGYAGTASWQAPEQFFPAAPGVYRTGYRSDYFSLGALFFYLVSGGQTLRFSRACGDAWRSHGLDGPATLLGRHGPPPTLQQDEAELFGRASGDAALDLLKKLLAARPEDRPANALEISRMLGAVHCAEFA